MSLPFVLDVAVGVVFIYLILSLLASEIQELITTLLQWRAKHLKDSIEILLAGGTETSETENVKDLVDDIYNHPLLRNVNQEAKGGVAKGFRAISRWLIPGNRKGNAFGKNQTSGPSYIQASVFSTSLLERLGLPILENKLTEIRVEKFVERVVGSYQLNSSGVIEIPEDSSFEENQPKGGTRLIAERSEIHNLNTSEDFKILVENYDASLKDFKAGKATLTSCIERMGESLNVYVASFKDGNPTYYKRLTAFKLGLFGENNDRAILSGSLRPTVAEIASLLNQAGDTYEELAEGYSKAKQVTKLVDAEVLIQLENYNKRQVKSIELEELDSEQHQEFVNNALVKLVESGQLSNDADKLYKSYQTYQRIEKILEKTPKSLKESLTSLAGRAEIRVEQATNAISGFQSEIEQWFDRSMTRAGGVYKRNSKGVAIILGLLLAAITNSDAFHITNRLASDENIRKVITEQASQFAPTSSTTSVDAKRLREIKKATDEALQDISLPIGWKVENMTRQFNCKYGGIQADDNFYKACLGSSGSASVTSLLQIVFAKPVDFLKMVLGWMISGIAISMGAPFWFDILGKVMRVKNSGGQTTSDASKTT